MAVAWCPGVSSPDDLHRHELKAEAEAEWTLEEKIRPKRPGPVAPRRPLGGGNDQEPGKRCSRLKVGIWISYDIRISLHRNN